MRFVLKIQTTELVAEIESEKCPKYRENRSTKLMLFGV